MPVTLHISCAWDKHETLGFGSWLCPGLCDHISPSAALGSSYALTWVLYGRARTDFWAHLFRDCGRKKCSVPNVLDTPSHSSQGETKDSQDTNMAGVTKM